MAKFKDQAICIRLFDWSETSQVVALLTLNHGKVRGVAKGAKRTSPSSVQRYSGGIELLTLGQAVGTIKQSAELANLTEWDLQKPYWHLHHDLDSQRLGFYAADLVNAMLADHDPHPPVFAALDELLDRLADGATRQVALLAFQWKLLSDCGYQPQLDRDVQSGDELVKARTYTFDSRAGGLTTAAAGHDGAWKVRASTVQLLRAAANGSDNKADRQTLMRANRLLCVYARAILDRQLPTMKYVLGDAAV